MKTIRLTLCGSNGNTSLATARAFKGAVFDMDGLLLDTERIYRRIFQQLVREQGYTLSDEGYRKMVGHRIDTSKQALAEELGTREPVDAIFAQVHGRYNDFIANETIPLRPGARELITFLRTQGIALALATSTYRSLTNAKLRNVGLEDAFALTVTGDEVANGKPAPDPYLKAVAGLGLRPQESFAMEDSPTGLRAAHSAGLFTILVPDLIPASAETLAIADMTVASLHDVLACLSPHA